MPRQMNPIVSVAVVSFILAICAVPILALGVFAVVVFSPSLPQATTSNAFFSTLFSVPGAVGVILLIAGYMLSFKSESASRRGRISRCPDGATKNLKKRDGKSNRRKSSSRDRRRIYCLHLSWNTESNSHGPSVHIFLSQTPHQDQVNSPLLKRSGSRNTLAKASNRR